jgi:hypothetical protein
VLDVRLEALVQQWLSVAVEGNDSNVETGPQLCNDLLEILEGHDPAAIYEVIVLVTLRTIYAPKVTGVDRLDGEEHRLAPYPVTLKEVAEPGGDPRQMSEVLHDVL